MRNFDFITTRLATGSALASAEDVAVLRGVGINAVIDCRDDFDDAQLFKGGMLYLWNGTPDDGKPKGPAWFKRSLAFALPLLAQPGYKVLCHCQAGINRGPSTAYAILRALGFSPIQAHAWIVTARPLTQFGLRYASDADQAVRELGYC